MPPELQPKFQDAKARAEVVPSRTVMSAVGEKWKRWKNVVTKEWEAFVKKQALVPATNKDLDKAANEQINAIPCKMVFTEKPVSEAQQKELGVSVPWKEKARICICGNFHPGIFDNVSATNADGHLLRLFLSQEASAHKILASTDVRNAFLNAKIEDDLPILMRPPPELIKMGIVERGTILEMQTWLLWIERSPKDVGGTSRRFA